MVKSIAIILARGGSKRLPRKNILEFGGKPMLAWSIEAAINSGCFDRVLVSTDDEEIATVGRRHGAQVPFLRQTAADDMSSSSEATLAAVAQAEKHWSESYDVVVQLMANCPLRGAADIKDAMEHFAASEANAQISCFRYGWMNPWWATQLDEDSRPRYLFEEARAMRSQDLPPLYCPTGAIWIAERGALLEARSFYTADCTFRPMPWLSALDIDDAEDLQMARACLALILRQPEKGAA